MQFLSLIVISNPSESQPNSLVPIHKWPIGPTSALREKFNPRNVIYMAAVKFFVRLDLNPIFAGL
jgi:hypothetical protein